MIVWVVHSRYGVVGIGSTQYTGMRIRVHLLLAISSVLQFAIPVLQSLLVVVLGFVLIWLVIKYGSARECY